MSDLQVCCTRPNSIFKENHPLMSSSLSALSSSPLLSYSNPDPSSIETECWTTAEEATDEIVCRIRPTLVSEHKRKHVIRYVQSLIRCSLGYEVFPYGSFPLKTYLPDGDIDLTALSAPNVEDALANDVCTVLNGEVQNEGAAYDVKDIQFVGGAEVKLVKCIVQNIVVDISFNQLGGLATLCFLEQVDCLVGKDHLFKRSIILIKAWCYYESRILGAHHGLISTYALETLVLCIFNVFHSSLNGPLAVLYRFLDYFSKFDWENYCISLNGPVCKSSLPDILAEVPENVVDGLLLTEEFIRSWVPVVPVETNPRAFPQKHLNIIDPLKENNNLGRSVNRGNFYRIRSAFRYGAHKLGQILSSPRHHIADELYVFFANTLERHGSHQKSDVENPFLIAQDEGSCSSPSSIKACSKGIRDHQTESEMECLADGIYVSEYLLARDAKELATSGFCRTASELSFDCSPSSNNLSFSIPGKSHFCYSGSFTGNRKIGYETPYIKFSGNSVVDGENDTFSRYIPKEASNPLPSCINHDSVSSVSFEISSPVAEKLCPSQKSDVVGSAEHCDSWKSLVDLSGDYESHIRSLHYGQCCHGYALSALALPTLPGSPSKSVSSDTVSHSLQTKWDFYSQMNTTGVFLGPASYHLKIPSVSGAAFGSEEKQKSRGTGTYLPIMGHYSFRNRPTLIRGRNPGTVTNSHLQRHSRYNGFATATTPSEPNFSEGFHELSRAQYAVVGREKSKPSDFHQAHPIIHGCSRVDAFSLPSEGLEFGSVKIFPSEVTLSEGRNHLESGSPRTQGSFPSLGAVQGAIPVLSNYQGRIAEQLYHLKNDDDFPPLSPQLPIKGS